MRALKTCVMGVACVLTLGCASNPAKTALQAPEKVIEVVRIPCSVEEPLEPVWVVDALEKGQDVFIQMRALLADREMSKGYELQLRTALRACKK